MTDPTHMNVDTQKLSIFSLIKMIENGEIRVPHFQRPYEWSMHDIKSFFESINNQFPVGTIYLWDTSDSRVKLNNHPSIPFPKRRMTYPTLFVVDGLQRLITLYATLRHPSHINDRKFDIVYDLARNTFHKDSSVNLQFPRVRLSTLLNRKEYKAMQRRLSHMDSGEELFESLMELYEAIRFHEMTVVTVTDIDEASVIDMFIRLNVSGKDIKPAHRRQVEAYRDKLLNKRIR